MNTDKQLDEILEDAIHAGYVGGYNEMAQNFRAAPYNHMEPVPIDQIKQALLQWADTLVSEARIATRASEAAWWYKNHANPDFIKADMLKHRYERLYEQVKAQLQTSKIMNGLCIHCGRKFSSDVRMIAHVLLVHDTPKGKSKEKLCNCGIGFGHGRDGCPYKTKGQGE